VIQPRGHEYPKQAIGVHPLATLASFLEKPKGLLDDQWPPLQLQYLDQYLKALGGQTVVIEDHYVDRDYVHDLSVFHARSLRSYPNYCHRFHFFKAAFDRPKWITMLRAAAGGEREDVVRKLQETYLGFMVVRPLPGTPVGRTVLATLGVQSDSGKTRAFGAVRDYVANVSGFRLKVSGLAFQQQDQAVSACATAALWSALHRVAPLEGLAVPTPAEITEGASRYFLADGRTMPSEGLTVHQICEATRVAGLAPLVIRSVSIEHDRAQLHGYLRSGFAPVMAIQPTSGGSGHAVCGVGLKLGTVLPRTDMSVHFRDAATSVVGAYVHDDRLGPYAVAELFPRTHNTEVRTGLRIKWSDGVESEESDLRAIIVPVPKKLRLTIARLRQVAMLLAETIAEAFSSLSDVTFSCRYVTASDYRESAFTFGLSDDGIELLNTGVVLSRYLGLIELEASGQPVCDILVDTTEARPNPSILALLGRQGLPAGGEKTLQIIAKNLGCQGIR
jgi:hypothetical protein